MHKRLQISAWTNSQFFYKLKIKVQLFSFNFKKKKKKEVSSISISRPPSNFYRLVCGWTAKFKTVAIWAG